VRIDGDYLIIDRNLRAFCMTDTSWFTHHTTNQLIQEARNKSLGGTMYKVHITLQPR